MAIASGARLIFVMTANEHEGATIARALVEERLAACVNLITPVRSIYRWRNAIEDTRECLLLIKTRSRHYAKIELRVKQLHSYEVPEIVAITFAHGAPDYLQWIREATAAPVRPSSRAQRLRGPKGRKAPRP